MRVTYLRQPHCGQWFERKIVRKPQQPLQGSPGNFKFEVVIDMVMDLGEEGRPWPIIR